MSNTCVLLLKSEKFNEIFENPVKFQCGFTRELKFSNVGCNKNTKNTNVE